MAQLYLVSAGKEDTSGVDSDRMDAFFRPGPGKVLSSAVHMCFSYCRKVGGQEMSEVKRTVNVRVSTPDVDKYHNIKLVNKTSENVSKLICE